MAEAFNPHIGQRAKIERVALIEKQASLSTDGGMVHLRGEGGKEVKMVSLFAVQPKQEQKRALIPMAADTNPMNPKCC